MKNQTVLIASDHAGFDLKQKLQIALPKIDWFDCGPSSPDRVDYPDFADRLITEWFSRRGAKLNATQTGLFGVLICGSGEGMAMRANRYPGVRAALCYSEETAELSREHNNANILALGARMIDLDLATRLVEIFLRTEFAGGRHADRVDKIDRPLLLVQSKLKG